ncbi:MAG TPA: arsenic resistance N-acetyltransferase ArsN2 [Rhodanobacter sp.]|nr:arsenic resistance N-acetyltransferase ArsN2 [Rhodanobacter sp.]
MKTRTARNEDYNLIRAALVASKLPVEDLSENAPIRFIIVDYPGAPFGGCIGLEVHGRDGLLRSLAVPSNLRAHGVGRTLVDAAQRLAATDGIERLWLLTITASTFFLRLGYEVADRVSAPERIKHSLQFASICPATAICMTRTL